MYDRKLDTKFKEVLESDNIYDPMLDPKFKRALGGRRLSPDSIHAYAVAAKVFYKCTGKTISDAYNEIKPLEKNVIQDGFLIMYNPNDSLIRDYFDMFYDYLVETGKSESTQNNYLKRMRVIFNSLELQLPKPIKVKETKKKKPLLRKKDIAFMFNISNTFYKALYCFLACTGIRISDAVEFTINDFIDATYDYHKCATLEKFLSKTHDDMIGYWEFVPKKTKYSSGVVCKVCNTPESNRYIIDALHERVKSIERQNVEKRTNVKIEGDDPLFPTYKNYFKEKNCRENVVTEATWKNKQLQVEMKKELKQLFEEGKITTKEYESRLNNLPNFHAHALRHFFISTIRAYLPNRDVSLIMEAHVSNIATDENYIGQSEELFDKYMIEDHYIKIMNHLIFSMEVDPEEFGRLKREKEEIENKYNYLKANVNNIAERTIEKKMENMLQNMGYMR